MPPLRHSDLVNTLVVSVNDTVVAGLLGVPAGLCAALRVRLLIQLLGNLVERLLDFFGGLLDGLDVGALVDFLQVVNGGLDGSLLGSVDLVAQLVRVFSVW